MHGIPFKRKRAREASSSLASSSLAVQQQLCPKLKRTAIHVVNKPSGASRGRVVTNRPSSAEDPARTAETRGGYFKEKQKKLKMDNMNVHQKSELFKGLKMWINGLVPELGQDGLKLLLLGHGAQVVNTEEKGINVVIANTLAQKKVEKLLSTKKQKLQEIVTYHWVLESVKAKRLLKYDRFRIAQAQEYHASSFNAPERVIVHWSNLLRMAAAATSGEELCAVAFQGTVLWIDPEMANTGVFVGMPQDTATRMLGSKPVGKCDAWLLDKLSAAFASAVEEWKRHMKTKAHLIGRSKAQLVLTPSVKECEWLCHVKRLIMKHLPTECTGFPVKLEVGGIEKQNRASATLSQAGNQQLAVERHVREGHLSSTAQPRAALAAMVQTLFEHVSANERKLVFTVKTSDDKEESFELYGPESGVIALSRMAIVHLLEENLSALRWTQVRHLHLAAVPVRPLTTSISSSSSSSCAVRVPIPTHVPSTRSPIDVRPPSKQGSLPLQLLKKNRSNSATTVLKNRSEFDMLQYLEANKNNLDNATTHQEYIAGATAQLIECKQFEKLQKLLTSLRYALAFEREFFPKLTPQFVNEVCNTAEQQFFTATKCKLVYQLIIEKL